MNKKRSRAGLVVAMIISVLVIVIALRATNPAVLMATLTSLSYSWLALSFLLFTLTYGLRTLRFRRLLRPQVANFPTMASLICLHGMFNYLLPGKTGEVSLPLLLKTRLNIGLSDGVAALALARFLDFLSIAVFLPPVLIVYHQRLPGYLIYLIIIYCAAVYLVCGIYIIFRRRKLTLDANITANHRWLELLGTVWNRVVNWLTSIRSRDYAGLIMLTMLIWLSVYANFYIIVRSLKFPMQFEQAIVLSVIMIPLTLLPFQGFANLGTHELGWGIAFALFGYSPNDALLISLSSHSILLMQVLLLGGFAFAWQFVFDF